MPAFYVLLLCVCLANPVFAQTFHATPGVLLEREVQLEQANECYIHFNNPSGDTLRLRWRQLDISLPDAWDVDACDYGSCYIGIPSNALMNVVYDTIHPYLKLIVQPGATPGAAWLCFRVYEEGNPDNFEDIYFSLFTPGTSGTNTITDQSVRAYPNPARDFLFLENNQYTTLPARLTDSFGRIVWQATLLPAANERIPVLDWPAGLYFLQTGRKTQKIVVGNK